MDAMQGRPEVQRRVWGAAMVGALIMFVWGGVSHMLLFKGAGFRHLPGEAALVTELHTAVPGEGLYFFPSLDFARASAQETRAWEKRFRSGPTGMILFHPAGDEPVSPRKLLRQFVSELLAALAAAYLLSWLVAPAWKRALAPALMGAFACLSVSALYWNWYGFPTPFFLAQCADKILGWALAGAAMAWWTRGLTADRR